MVRPLALALAAALAACSDPAPGPGAPDADPSGLMLTRDGAGRLGAETPFDTAAVRAALPPGFAAERHDGQTGAPEIWALRDGQIVFEVTAGPDGATVGRIAAPNMAVAGPGGARAGQSFAEAGGARLGCAIGTGDLADRAVCERDGVALVFASQSLVGQTRLPPADSLASAFLERLVWRADG